MSFINNSALESFEQALLHWKTFEESRETKHLRFTLIHLDCSAELMFKALLIFQDRLFFQKAKKMTAQTISLPQCMERFGTGEILHVNEFRILHEMRNSAQHLGILHDEAHATEIINKVLISIRHFLETKFNLELESLNSYLERIGERKEVSSSLLEIAEISFNSGDLPTAFILKHDALELFLRQLAGSFGLDPKDPLTGEPAQLRKLTVEMQEKHLINQEENEEINISRNMKNILLHYPELWGDIDIKGGYESLTLLTNSIKEKIEKAK